MLKKIFERIHTPGDGRGPRKVFCDGEELHGCVYADVKKGIADCHHQPPKIDRWGKRILTHRVRGMIHVEPIKND